MRSMSLVRPVTLRALFGSFQKSGWDCLTSSSASSAFNFRRSKKPPERCQALFEAINADRLQVGEYGLVCFFHKGVDLRGGGGESKHFNRFMPNPGCIEIENVARCAQN